MVLKIECKALQILYLTSTNKLQVFFKGQLINLHTVLYVQHITQFTTQGLNKSATFNKCPCYTFMSWTMGEQFIVLDERANHLRYQSCFAFSRISPKKVFPVPTIQGNVLN